MKIALLLALALVCMTFAIPEDYVTYPCTGFNGKGWCFNTTDGNGANNGHGIYYDDEMDGRERADSGRSPKTTTTDTIGGRLNRTLPGLEGERTTKHPRGDRAGLRDTAKAE